MEHWIASQRSEVGLDFNPEGLTAYLPAQLDLTTPSSRPGPSSYSSLHPLPCSPQKGARVQQSTMNSIMWKHCWTPFLAQAQGQALESNFTFQKNMICLSLPCSKLRWRGWGAVIGQEFVLGSHADMQSLAWHGNWPIGVDLRSSGGPCCAMAAGSLGQEEGGDSEGSRRALGSSG